MKKTIIPLLVSGYFFIMSCGGSSSDSNNKSDSISGDKKLDNIESKSDLTVDEKVEKIRTLFQQIESSGKSLKVVKKEFRNADPEKYYDMSQYEAYYKGSELVKLVELAG